LPFHVIAAGDDSPQSFRETAKALGISERSRFEPSREDVLDFYAAADLYVSPTGENSFGLPIAEAMACGLPIITSMHAGVAHSMRDGMDGSVFPNSMIFRSSHGCSSGFGRTKPCGEMPVMRRRPLTDGAGTGMPPTSGSCGRKLPARNLRLLHKDRMARPRISGPGGALRLLCVSLPA